MYVFFYLTHLIGFEKKIAGFLGDLKPRKNAFEFYLPLENFDFYLMQFASFDSV